MGEGNSSIEALREEVTRLQRENGMLLQERDQLLEEVQRALRSNQSLVEELERLRRRHFGRSSEKMHPNQLLLWALTEEPGDQESTGTPEVTEAPASELAPDDESALEPPRKSKRRKKKAEPVIPPDLPTEEVLHDLPEEEKVCPGCQEQLVRIGEDVSEQLEYVPARMLRIRHVRVKYACKGCESCVKRAPAPERPLPKALPGPLLLAWIIVSKYKDHLPLHRLSRILARHRVKITRSTLCDWVMAVAERVAPVVECMRREILASDYIQTDDTRVMAQVPLKADPQKRKMVQAYLWPYRAGNQVVYDFTLSRSRDGPNRFLQEFRGTLQTDDYAGYNDLRKRTDIVGIGCFAHARRGFVDAKYTDLARTGPILACIRLLYRIERDAKEVAAKRAELEINPAVAAVGSEANEIERARILAEERLRARRERSRPLLADLLRLVRRCDHDAGVPPETLLGKAVGYFLRNRRQLTRYSKDGSLEIDNNSVEQCVRPIALGRKNWLFAGSPRGGKAAATLYSLIETCRLLEVEPFQYLTDLLRRLPSATPDQIGSLTPREWKRARASQTVTC